MDNAKKRELLFAELRSHARSYKQSVVDRTTGREERATVGNVDYYKILGQYITTDEAIEALDRVIDATCKGLIHSILCIFDGNSEICDHYYPAIVDAQTGESIQKGEHTALHDQFVDYLIEQGDNVTI